MNITIKNEPEYAELDEKCILPEVEFDDGQESCTRCPILQQELDDLKDKYNKLLEKLKYTETNGAVVNESKKNKFPKKIVKKTKSLENIDTDESDGEEVSVPHPDENYVDVETILEQNFKELDGVESLPCDIVPRKRKQRKPIARKRPVVTNEGYNSDHSESNVKTDGEADGILGCKYCEEKFEGIEEQEQHQKTHVGPKQFKCLECGKICIKRSDLRKHMRSHTGEKLYQCDICENWFSHSSALTAHKRTHTGEKPFGCHICGKYFSQTASLRGHMQTHTGEKPFLCTQCGKRYAKKTALTVHIRTHTGERPFACPECNFTFSEKSRLTCHMRKHTGEKPHICEICGLGCRRNNDLTKHMRTHTTDKPFTCELCPSAFREAFFLKRHIVDVHTDIKLFACDLCDKKFSRYHDLGRHRLNSHVGTRPYACNMCDKTYGEKYGLQRHIKAHTSGKLRQLKGREAEGMDYEGPLDLVGREKREESEEEEMEPEQGDEALNENGCDVGSEGRSVGAAQLLPFSSAAIMVKQDEDEAG